MGMAMAEYRNAEQPETGPNPDPARQRNDAVFRVFAIIGIVVLGTAALYQAGSLIVPVAQAVIVWMILNAFASWLQRLPGIGRRLPGWAALLIAVLATLAIGMMMGQIVLRSVVQVSAELQSFHQVILPMIELIAARFGVDDQTAVQNILAGVRFDDVARSVVTATVSTISQSGIVAVYVGFLLADQQLFGAKLTRLIPDPARRSKAKDLIHSLSRALFGYLQVMTFASVLTALLSYIILRLVGMETAGFWATAIFFLNYIPTIGSIIGTALPPIFVLLELQALGPALIALAGIGSVQFVIGNILVPRLFGDRLNVSLVVIFVSIFAFGMLWGVTGMFVAMPLTAMMIIVFAHFEGTRPIAIMLSGDGDVIDSVEKFTAPP